MLSQIAPREAELGTSAMAVSDPQTRAEKMLEDADKIGCRKFVRAEDVVRGNGKLNLAFVVRDGDRIKRGSEKEGIEERRGRER